MKNASRGLALLAGLTLLGTTAVGCDVESPQTGDEEDLTSLTARSRELKFEGVVYVSSLASDSEITSAIDKQTRTAFGPLRTSNVGVNDRELKGVDSATWKKRTVKVVDTSKAGDPGKQMLEVRYTYVDDAVVPVSMSTKSSFSSAIMRPNYQSEGDRILKECTANDAEAHDFATSLWYVFEPSLSSCKTAIKKEADAVTAARAKLASTQDVALVEANRLYIPVTMQLGADKTNTGKSYPEYDKLFGGAGVKPGKLVISLLNGLIDHGEGAPMDLYKDSGYSEWLDSVEQVIESRPTFKLLEVEGGVDITSYTLKSGKKVSNLGFTDFIAFNKGTGFPSGLTSADKTDLKKQIGDRVADKWITLEMPATVKIGSGKAKTLGIQLKLFFGHSDVIAPYKTAIKNSDVFIYNGHSFIGNGPLDPKNFTSADFPSTYQLLFIDSCVSYNYYESDFFPMKPGGSKTLDMITNGVEAPAFESGFALGQFIATLIDGKQESYLDLLRSAEATGEAMRVVDGELDNKYKPSSKKITITPQ